MSGDEPSSVAGAMREPDPPPASRADGLPRGVRAMAVVRWCLVLAMAVIAAFSVAHGFGLMPSDGAREGAARYYCPMHPQIVKDTPGECPICHMTLVPLSEGGAESQKKAAVSHSGHRHEASDPYYCPMHPEETSNDANARCPICGMKLEKRRTPAPAPAGSRSAAKPGAPAPVPSDVPGLVPLELSLDRVQLIGVRTAVAAAEALAAELRTVGFVSADEARLARVHARFPGWIERLAVATTGAKVRRGQVLAELYHPELLPAQHEFLTARGWSAATGTAGGGATQALPLELSARRRLELFGMSKSEIDGIARSGTATRTIAVTAPLGGHVIRKQAVQGAYVEPGTELFEIADLSKIWVLADVYEHDIARVRIGQTAAVVVSAFPAEPFPGTLSFVYPTLDPGTRTLRVRFELDNRDARLRPGMYADVTLTLAASEGVVIPTEALVDTGELKYVFLAKPGGRFEPRRVRTGARSGSKVAILEGVAAGETVVTTANFLIDSESRLRAAVEGKAAVPEAHGSH
jgi:membrane fusion protein, copper/silver efflux system